jgi:hypothetical protein
MNQSSSRLSFLPLSYVVLHFVQNVNDVLDLLLAPAEPIDGVGLLDDDLPDYLVVLAGALDFGNAEVGQLPQTGEVAHEAHEDAELVRDLLVDVELHLPHATLTSSR